MKDKIVGNLEAKLQENAIKIIKGLAIYRYGVKVKMEQLLKNLPKG